MTSTARLLCLMGSGETAPPMASVHADLMRRVDSPPGRAVMLDTPYGFQENADEISARARAYFRVNVGHPLEVASLRDQESADPVALARLHDQLGDARYIFAGPGSPSYALRQWRGNQVTQPIASHLARGGWAPLPPAAAPVPCRVALPPVERYKVWGPPPWLAPLHPPAP